MSGITVKVALEWDEAYPVYFLFVDDAGSHYGIRTTVPEEFWVRYQRVTQEYQQLQDELQEMRFSK